MGRWGRGRRPFQLPILMCNPLLARTRIGCNDAAHMRWLVAVAPLLVVMGCSASPDEVASTSQEIGSATQPVILVPTSSAAIDACASSLAMTFCSAADADKARAACERAIPESAKDDCDADRGCVFAFPTERAPACHAGVTYPSKASCATPQPDDCSFYASCMESSIACGPDGYARSFGEPLCYKFLERRDDFSPHAQHWLKGVRQCLQQQMVPLLAKSGQTCSALEDAAYASHVTCYTNPTDSICQVGFSDLLVLFGIIHDELFSAQGFQQVKGVARACLTQWFSGSRPRVATASNADPRAETLFRDLANADDHSAMSRVLDVARMQNATTR